MTRAVTTKSMAAVAHDNLGFLSLFFDAADLPAPKGYANARELEVALTQPNIMKTTLVGIQFDDNLASELII